MSTGTYPVVEIFGPTVQGEGPQAGSLTSFVRFGGCDYRCSWCDSLYAVLPEQWKNAPRLGDAEIIDTLGDQHMAPWVTLSGGNPAMYPLGDLVERLQLLGWKVAVETQGSKWLPWLANVNSLVLSPKPPSSGMVSPLHDEAWQRFTDKCYRKVGRDYSTAVKIVVFDDEDYDWALDLFARMPKRMWQLYLSVGTDPPPTEEEVREKPSVIWDNNAFKLGVLDRWTWLCEKLTSDPRAGSLEVRALPQLHVLAWAHARAV